MFARGFLAASAALVLVAQPASALSFNFTQASGATLTSDQASAFQAAANAWSAVLSDAVTVNIRIGFTSLGSNILGATSATLGTATATSVRNHLAADAKSADDNTAVASLPSFAGTDRIQLTTAQAKAIGYSYLGSDGTIEFSSDYSFSTSRNADGSVASGTYDLIGIAEHEIAHLLGFQSSIDNGSYATVLDEFRYGAAGVRSTAAGSAYFSIDGGTTALASFSTGNTNDDYQAAHWAMGTASGGIYALMDPAVSAGTVQNITALDLRALDVLGYDVVVPEPASVVVLALGLAGAGLSRRRRAA